MSNIQETLIERGKRYGSFDGHARITWGIKHTMRVQKQWEYLPADMKEALDMIAHKIGRILNGDPNYADSWIDIAGYAQLIVNRLEGLNAKETTQPNGNCPVDGTGFFSGANNSGLGFPNVWD